MKNKEKLIESIEEKLKVASDHMLILIYYLLTNNKESGD